MGLLRPTEVPGHVHQMDLANMQQFKIVINDSIKAYRPANKAVRAIVTIDGKYIDNDLFWEGRAQRTISRMDMKRSEDDEEIGTFDLKSAEMVSLVP